MIDFPKSWNEEELLEILKELPMQKSDLILSILEEDQTQILQQEEEISHLEAQNTEQREQIGKLQDSLMREDSNRKKMISEHSYQISMMQSQILEMKDMLEISGTELKMLESLNSQMKADKQRMEEEIQKIKTDQDSQTEKCKRELKRAMRLEESAMKMEESFKIRVDEEVKKQTKIKVRRNTAKIMAREEFVSAFLFPFLSLFSFYFLVEHKDIWATVPETYRNVSAWCLSLYARMYSWVSTLIMNNQDAPPRLAVYVTIGMILLIAIFWVVVKIFLYVKEKHKRLWEQYRGHKIQKLKTLVTISLWCTSMFAAVWAEEIYMSKNDDPGISILGWWILIGIFFNLLYHGIAFFETDR